MSCGHGVVVYPSTFRGDSRDDDADCGNHYFSGFTPGFRSTLKLSATSALVFTERQLGGRDDRELG